MVHRFWLQAVTAFSRPRGPRCKSEEHVSSSIGTGSFSALYTSKDDLLTPRGSRETAKNVPRDRGQGAYDGGTVYITSRVKGPRHVRRSRVPRPRICGRILAVL